MSKLILISGKAEHGKTLLANIMKKKLEIAGKRVLLFSFAAYLKFICKQYYGWDGKKDEKGRTLLQHLGTDVVRKKNPDYWVKTIYEFIETFEDEFDFFIADDVRFENEIEYFRNIGIIDFLSIRIEREDFENSLTEEQKNHLSETSLDNYPFDLFLLCETGVKNAERVVDELMEYEKGIANWLYR